MKSILRILVLIALCTIGIIALAMTPETFGAMLTTKAVTICTLFAANRLFVYWSYVDPCIARYRAYCDSITEAAIEKGGRHE